MQQKQLIGREGRVATKTASEMFKSYSYRSYSDLRSDGR